MNPVPKSASTITSGVPTSVSPALASTSRTSRPASSRYRAATRPSPPLFPPPQTTVIRRACSKCAIRTSATAFPARSISSSTSCALLGPAHLLGRVQRLKHRLTTATAAASSFECVIDSSTSPDAQPLGALAQPPGEPHRRLGPAADLDLAPGEVDGDAEAERLADRLLAREPGRIVLGRVRPRVAVRALGIGEAARAEPGVARERSPDTLDLDQVDADVHGTSSPFSRMDAIAGESSGEPDPGHARASRSGARRSASARPGRAARAASTRRSRRRGSRRCSTSRRRRRSRKGRSGASIARAGADRAARSPRTSGARLRNRELALERLVASLREALRVPRPRRPTRPHSVGGRETPRREAPARRGQARPAPDERRVKPTLERSVSSRSTVWRSR